jgi:hypothetical protein
MRSHAARFSIAALLVLGVPAAAFAQALEYKVLATSKTSTMEKELNQAGAVGWELRSVMGGETGAGGKETVAVLSRDANGRGRFEFRLLATSKTSTMQREMQAAADAGYDYKGQTVFESLLGGREVVVVMQRDADHPTRGDVFKLLATTRTSTMEKELQAAGRDGYVALGMTVGQTAMGGRELVTIMRRREQ